MRDEMSEIRENFYLFFYACAWAYSFVYPVYGENSNKNSELNVYRWKERQNYKT